MMNDLRARSTQSGLPGRNIPTIHRPLQAQGPVAADEAGKVLGPDNALVVGRPLREHSCDQTADHSQLRLDGVSSPAPLLLADPETGEYRAHLRAISRGDGWPTWMCAPEVAPGTDPQAAMNGIPLVRRKPI